MTLSREDVFLSLQLLAFVTVIFLSIYIKFPLPQLFPRVFLAGQKSD